MMKRPNNRWLFLTLVLLVVGLSSFCDAQEDEEISGDYVDLSGSLSSSQQSDSVPIEDKNPCSFRGNFLLHKQQVRLDPCTECTCANGTTTCNIESCPAESGCDATEIVIIPEECCPQCPYRMFVEDTIILHDDAIDFTIGKSKRIKFGLDIQVDRKLTSRYVRGEDLWKLSTWVSANEDGSGPRYSFRDNVFTELDAAKEYSKPEYPPWQWNKLRTTLNFAGGTCEEFKFFCVEFGEGINPQPTYELDFSMRPINDEQERLIDCKPLGTCVGGCNFGICNESIYGYINR